VAVLVVTGAIVAAVLLRSQPGHPAAASPPPTAATSSSPVAINTVSVFMNVNRVPDNPLQTQYTFDGNPNTAWLTDVYRSATFGNLYRGIGLAIHLSSSKALHQLVVTSSTQGWAAETYVSTTEVPTGSALSLWGQPTDTLKSIPGNATFQLKGRTGSWVLLWLTNLGPSFRAQVNELSVS
jgi:hypothetical protein